MTNEIFAQIKTFCQYGPCSAFSAKISADEGRFFLGDANSSDGATPSRTPPTPFPDELNGFSTKISDYHHIVDTNELVQRSLDREGLHTRRHILARLQFFTLSLTWLWV